MGKQQFTIGSRARLSIEHADDGLSFRTSQGNRVYLTPEEAEKVYRFIKKWHKNKPKTEVIEGSTNPDQEESLWGIISEMGYRLSNLFGTQSVPAEAIEAELVLSLAASTDAEYILGALQQHEGLANVLNNELLSVAKHIAREETCADSMAGYDFSWVIDPLRGKVVTVTLQKN